MGFHVTRRKEVKKPGYYAYHLKIEGTQYRPLLCELQIKTVLNDAWSAKTHDLIYKPLEEIDDTLERQMNKMEHMLRLLDEQSEVIKDLIMKKLNSDNSRKAVAKQNLLMFLLYGHGEKKPYDDEITILAQSIQARIKYFENALRADSDFHRIEDKIWDLIRAHGYNSKICYLLTLLASVRQSGDLNRDALNVIDSWKANCSSSRSKEEEVKALLLRAIANYAFGKFKDAITDADEALECCEANIEFRINNGYSSISPPRQIRGIDTRP
jgi:hypothetical protein